MRSFALRTPVIYLLAALLPPIVLGGIGSMLYLGFHDDLVASLMARLSQQQYAYEDRIEALRGEVEAQTRHQTDDRASVETKMRDLVLRQAKLESRAALVAGLTMRPGVARAGTAGTSWAEASVPAQRLPKALDAPFRIKNPPTELPEGLLSYAPSTSPSLLPLASAKPHPVSEPIEPESETARAPGPVSALDDSRLAFPTRLSRIAASLDKVERVQVGALLRLGSQARDEAALLRGAIQEAGLSPERFKAGAASDVGGPFVPMDERNTAFGDALSGLHNSLTSADRWKAVVAGIPLVGPLPGAPEITSPFGARLDPFLGRAAVHTGVDLRQDYGADVRSTAAGRVIFAGTLGGYGNMVEIDHGNGLSTRYAHLSQIEVSEGQSIDKSAVVGQIGTTGRSTGPHLHYEVRIDREPVDPVRFLTAGAHLASADVP